MKVAIAKEGNNVSAHFGHCEGFEVFNVRDNTVESREFIENPGHIPGFLPKFLGEKNINIIIAGGMGERAQMLFNENNIEVIVGAQGPLEAVIKSYLKGGLESTGSVCTEHEHEGSCGGH